jgi:DNA-binding transcriptional MerR regulator
VNSTENEKKTFSMDDLAKLTGLGRRTIRYYIQEGLVARPDGNRRAATYRHDHLEQLLAVKRLQADGYSLEGIRRQLSELSHKGHEMTEPKPGTVELRSLVHLAPGVVLQIDVDRAGLDGWTLGELARRVSQVIEDINSIEEDVL